MSHFTNAKKHENTSKEVLRGILFNYCIIIIVLFSYICNYNENAVLHIYML